MFQKRATSENLFLIVWQKNVPGPWTNWKRIKNNLLSFLLLPEGSFIIATFRMVYIRMFLLSTGLAPSHCDYMRFTVHLSLCLTCGSHKWTSAVWRSKPGHLGEPVRIHIIQSFVYSGVKGRDGLIFSTVWKWTNFSHEINPNRSIFKLCSSCVTNIAQLFQNSLQIVMWSIQW